MTFEASLDTPEKERASLPLFVGRALVIAGVIGVVGYFVLGMPGMDHSAPGAMGAMDHAADVATLTPEEFATALREPSAFLVNVHVPVEGSIEGTDAFMPYDAVNPSLLPDDKDAPVLLYCETGRMSEEAAAAVLAAGYGDVRHLAGGTDAWSDAGFGLTSAST